MSDDGLSVEQVEKKADIDVPKQADSVEAPKNPNEPPAKIVEPDVRILISRDRMEASLVIALPPGSRALEMDEVLDKIQKNGVVFGLKHDVIKKAYDDASGFGVVCATGEPAVNGVNGSIVYKVNMENKGRPDELEDGSVDFKNLNLFTMVQEGDILAEKILATPGTTGTDVLGNPCIAKPGKEAPNPVGKNVLVVENTFVAAISGQVLIANNKINVVPVIEIKEDVDVSTGNIEFIGDVIVRGSVQPGFEIKAEGNVEIYGTVSGGTVEGRNVIIKMGVQGMHRGYIRAKENVVAKFIENATLHAGVDILVSDVVLNSRISAGKRVIVDGKKGLIVGGTVMAGEEIRAKIVGTHMATITALEVGVNPMLREEYQHIRGEIKKVDVNSEKTQKALNILRSMDQSSMAPDKREMLLKLTKAQFHLAGQGETMRKRIAAIEEEFAGMREGRIKVQDTIFPGVKIVVGTLIKPISEALKFASLYAEDGEIKIGSFK